jgi:hypothetical protein
LDAAHHSALPDVWAEADDLLACDGITATTGTRLRDLAKML